MDRQERHRGIEAVVLEGEIVGRGLDRRSRRGIALADHFEGRLDRSHRSIGRFVGASSCADVEDRLGIRKRLLDRFRDVEIGLTKLRVVDPDAVVERAHRGCML